MLMPWKATDVLTSIVVHTPPTHVDSHDAVEVLHTCVVSMMPAMLHAFCRPLRVTFAGSMTPAFKRSCRGQAAGEMLSC